MMRSTAFALLLLAVGASAQEEEDPADQSEAEGKSSIEAQAPAEEKGGRALGGAGISRVTTRPGPRSGSVGGKAGGGSAGSGGAAAGSDDDEDDSGEHPAVSRGKNQAFGEVYDSFRAVPKDSGGRATLKFKGPGHGIAVRFHVLKKPSADSWAIVQDPRGNTNLCGFVFFISRSPGGAAVSPKCDKRSGSTGNRIGFMNGKPPAGDLRYGDVCVLEPDRDYYVNIGLSDWNPNPHAGGVYGCDMFLSEPMYYGVQGNQDL